MIFCEKVWGGFGRDLSLKGPPKYYRKHNSRQSHNIAFTADGGQKTVAEEGGEFFSQVADVNVADICFVGILPKRIPYILS